jgi:hypothetical protein
MFYLFVISAVNDKENDVQNGGNRWYISLNFRRMIVFRKHSLFRNSICIPLPSILSSIIFLIDEEKNNSKLDTENCSTSVLNKSSNLNLCFLKDHLFRLKHIENIRFILFKQFGNVSTIKHDNRINIRY